MCSGVKYSRPVISGAIVTGHKRPLCAPTRPPSTGGYSEAPSLSNKGSVGPKIKGLGAVAIRGDKGVGLREGE